MKQGWGLTARNADLSAGQLTGYYGRRWGIDNPKPAETAQSVQQMLQKAIQEFGRP